MQNLIYKEQNVYKYKEIQIRLLSICKNILRLLHKIHIFTNMQDFYCSKTVLMKIVYQHLVMDQTCLMIIN